jgi:hypothetical protein
VTEDLDDLFLCKGTVRVRVRGCSRSRVADLGPGITIVAYELEHDTTYAQRHCTDSKNVPQMRSPGAPPVHVFDIGDVVEVIQRICDRPKMLMYRP